MSFGTHRLSKKSGWKEASAEYPRRALLINATWVDSNVPGFMKNVQPEVKYEQAPDILHLEEHEKFVDEKGDTIVTNAQWTRFGSGHRTLARCCKWKAFAQHF
jgi:hypothetical protein